MVQFKIDDYVATGIKFEIIPYVIEIFPSPLPLDLYGNKIEDAFDLLLTSQEHGFSELFFPDSEKVFGLANGRRVQIKRSEFLAWQLIRASTETLYHLANKTGTDLASILNFENEYAANDSYDPDTWMNPYLASPEEYKKGLELIDRLKQDHTVELINKLVDGICNQYSGVLQGLETRVTSNFGYVCKLYAGWPVPLMFVTSGKFYPYIDPSEGEFFKRDEFQIDEMYVRNYDEGDIRIAG
jgi:hypothetical protein